MCNYLLTIAIPTYNRSFFLKRCLGYLYSQKLHLRKVELIVSDNASTDDTTEVVQHYIALGLNILYKKNETNKGPDFNIAQCYRCAKGKFILVLGDDDVLINNSIVNILELLSKNQDAGIVFLNSFGIVNEKDELFFNKSEAFNYKIYNSQKSFLHYVTYNVTFISGNIVNSSVVNTFAYSKWLGSCLVQVPLILTVIKKFPKNIVVNSKLLAVQIDNTGGYNLYKIFGKNLNEIVNEIFTDDFIKYKKIIINDLFIRFFPVWIRVLRKQNKFDSNIPLAEIKNLLHYNNYYWLVIHPLLVLPVQLNLIFFYAIKIFGIARRKVLLFLNN